MRLAGYLLAFAAVVLVSCPVFGNPSGIRYAILEGDMRLARKALDSSPDAIREMNAGDHWRHTPLHLAAMSGSVDIARLLISSGANLNAKNQYSETPLHLAAQSAQQAMVELLIKAGADVNAKAEVKPCAAFAPLREKWKTPLSYAANPGIEDMIHRAGGTE